MNLYIKDGGWTGGIVIVAPSVRAALDKYVLTVTGHNYDPNITVDNFLDHFNEYPIDDNTIILYEFQGDQ